MRAFRKSLFTAFSTPGFRFQWSADLLAAWAFEMETLILGWYILVSTGSIFLLTVFGALQFSGTLLAPWFGTLADRVSRRTLLLVLRGAFAGSALLLAILDFGGWLGVWPVFAVALIGGLLRPADQVVRNALYADTVPAEQLSNAMGLARTTMDSARIAGALAGAGVFSLLGFGAAYLVVTLFYAASVAFTRRIETGRPHPSGATAWRELVVGARYIADSTRMSVMMWLAFLVNVTAYPVTHGLMPYVAREVYGTDANGLARLSAAFAAGALAGSLWFAAAARSAHALRLVVAGIAAWYVLLAVFAFTPGLGSGMVVLALTGAAQSLSMVSMMVVLLAQSAVEYRGRVMGVRMLAVYGLPLGLLAAGPVIDAIGFRAQTTLFALTGLSLTLWTVWRWRRDL